MIAQRPQTPNRPALEYMPTGSTAPLQGAQVDPQPSRSARRYELGRQFDERLPLARQEPELDHHPRLDAGRTDPLERAGRPRAEPVGRSPQSALDLPGEGVERVWRPGHAPPPEGEQL